MSEPARIIESFMTLLAERRFEEIGFADIATQASLPLAEIRQEFGSTIAIVAGHMKEIDGVVLASGAADIVGPPAERLRMVLASRLEALAPRKQAIRSLLASARRNPLLACSLNAMAVRSQLWMLEAAGLPAAGPSGLLRAQGLAMLFRSVLRTWLEDEDPEIVRTLAALDRRLARGHRLIDLATPGARLSGFFERLRRDRQRAQPASDNPA